MYTVRSVSFLTRNSQPIVFWFEAIDRSIHILNKNLTLVVQDKTLKKAWSRQRPVVDHLIIFRCIAYGYFLDQKEEKTQ